MRPRSGQRRWCRSEAQACSLAVSLRSPFHSDPSWRRCDSHAQPIIQPTYGERSPRPRFPTACPVPVQPLVSSSAHSRGPLGRDPAAPGSNCVDAFIRRATVHGTGQAGSGRERAVELRVIYHVDAWGVIHGLLPRPHRGLLRLRLQAARILARFSDGGLAAGTTNGAPRRFRWRDASRACSPCEDEVLSVGGGCRATQRSCAFARQRANPHFTWRRARKRTLALGSALEPDPRTANPSR